MRKIFVPFLLLLASSQLSFGKSVDENTAKTIGCNFFKTEGKTVKTTDMSLAYQATSDVNGMTITDFYVFNSGNSGFVIVSGDDNVTPVLGYDLESTFTYNKLFVNINGYLNTYVKEINYVIKNNTAPKNETTEQWATLAQGTGRVAARTTATSVAPLVHAYWNQSPFVNDLCPYSTTDSSYAVTGCVATAMAQVMKYWGWPVVGAGSHSYNSPMGHLSADFALDTFNWSLMPNGVTDSNYQVAKLMYDAGVSVNMSYGVTESGAFVTAASSPITNCAEYALKTYFGYNDTMIQGVSRYSDDSAWVLLLKSEIDAKRPVLYTGDGSQGGHCFVCDGYQPGNRMHFNWGWGGYCNGYYTVESMAPGGTDLNADQTVIIGIMPDTMAVPQTVVTPPVTGVTTVSATGAVNIYPNPATEVINIDLQGTKVTQIRIADLQGRVVNTITPTSSIVSVSVSNLSEGMYLVQLQTAQGIVTKKIVVSK